ncbi:SurA N-terminal domain-containing protein [Streptomyces sp. NBC_01381]|uniref:SurA N-terminal domain-containing protein n=1 Tax=Streptomyces sp. NBC_01381 TaxID=2903845 RepID=UPI0022538875|nr:SurA N-terminal domain-containing protein [Streptomyces sp. NBC_01381]MCX4666701.1 SurA N-terminal domain-containing protein [Streptomyces sp. NBC_01381]
MHRRRRTALALSVAAIAAAPLLTACGSEAHPGAAAVVGDDRITVAQLEGRVNEVRDAQRAAVPDDQQYEQAIAKSGGLTRSTLHTMVLDKVLHQAATDAGVDVSRREIQTMRAGLEQQAGGKKALEQGWLQQYSVAPSRLEDSLRTEIEAQKLAKTLGADMNSPEGQAAFWKALSAASKKLDVDLNPRYGTWDVEKSKRADTKTPWVRDVSEDAAAGPRQA